MKIALIGASGHAGSRILAELAARGHQVTAIARDTAKIAAGPGVTPAKGDITEPEALAEVLRGHDVVISSVHFLDFDKDLLLAAVRGSRVARYYVVGGAGSLEVAPGVLLNATPQFPAAAQAESAAGAVYLAALRAQKDLTWTYLSPSALFFAGERTGTFRLGKDQLLVGPNGSSISFEDYAIALADEIEDPKHTGQRFTVGY